MRAAASSQAINESIEAAMLRRYVQHVEREVLAAKDERTRWIRLVILACVEVELAKLTSQ